MPVSNLKLQKLLYFVQAYFLAKYGTPCFREDIEAWDFGPVVPAVYHRYKVYGSSAILSAKRYLFDGMRELIKIDDSTMIDEIIEECSKFSASQLVDITHKQSPWINAYARYKGNIISKESIKEFFTIKQEN